MSIDKEALAEAAGILGTSGVQETVTAALTQISELYLRVEAHNAELAAKPWNQPWCPVNDPEPENYQE